MDQLNGLVILNPLVALDAFVLLLAVTSLIGGFSLRAQGDAAFGFWQKALRGCLATQQAMNCNVASQYWKNLVLIVLLCVLFTVTIRRLLTRLLQFCGFGPNGIVPGSRLASLRRWATRHQYRMCRTMLRKLEGAGINGFSVQSTILMALVGCVIGYRVGKYATGFKF